MCRGVRHVEQHPVAPIDRRRLRLIYAGSQERRPAGLTSHRPRRLDRQALPATPTAFDYKIVADNDSSTHAANVRSTSPGWSFKWIEARAGWRPWKRATAKMAALLYDYLDTRSSIAPRGRAKSAADERCHSSCTDERWTRIPQGCEGARHDQMKGHRSSVAARVDLKRMPEKASSRWSDYLRDFEKNHG